MLRPARGLPVAIAALPIAALLGIGCSDDEGSGPVATEPEIVPTNVSDESAFVAAYAKALEDRDLAAYAALLEEPDSGRPGVGFRFIPRDPGRDDLPQLPDDGTYGYAVELDILGKMFDPELEDYVTETGEIARRVTEITCELAVRSTENQGNGVVRVSADADLYVWFSSTDALHSTALFEFHLAPDATGFLRLRQMQERDSLLRPRESVIESDAWSAIKSLYRSPA